MTALILVNLQNDYLTGGAVPVPDGDAIIPLANQLEGQFKLVVATQDWHPPHHSSFVTQYPGKHAGEVVQLRRGRQQLRPVHCVQNTRGAELASALMLNRVNKVIRTGTDPNLESYSGFFESDHLEPTGLHEYLQEKKVTEIYVLGLPTEEALQHTALDGLELGYKTCVIPDACRGRNPSEAAAALGQLKQEGAALVSSREVLDWLRRR